jgi:hypothetical protein
MSAGRAAAELAQAASSATTDKAVSVERMSVMLLLVGNWM